MTKGTPFFSHEHYCSDDTGVCERTDKGHWTGSGTSASVSDGLVDSARRNTAKGFPTRVVKLVYDETVPGSFRHLGVVWEPARYDLRPVRR